MLIKRPCRRHDRWSDHTWIEPGVVICTCGGRVELYDPLTNECKTCGTLWNCNGQALKPRREREED